MNTNNSRRVQFFPQHERVLEIDTLEHYTEQEILNSWYTKEEFKTIAMRSHKHALRWESGESSMPDSFHRGLEIFTEEGEHLVTASIERCIDAVMDEQAAQWESDVDDFDRLAAISAEVSKFSVNYALEQAVADEQEAHRMYKAMEQKINLQQKLKSRDSSKKNVLDSSDHTSICSDLSHPEAESIRSTRDSLSQAKGNNKATKAISRRLTNALTMPKIVGLASRAA
ncbi:unnamed protein product [Cylindrotheca closterium]|uniref:Uncharacterized protein n=1 Tax=Cylindrotheca closterium TaxID=2856 RepID=A0AAD2CEU2_9STRA|nr:unnamed protein product [Cylindrotheca closterium]